MVVREKLRLMLSRSALVGGEEEEGSRKVGTERTVSQTYIN